MTTRIIQALLCALTLTLSLGAQALNPEDRQKAVEEAEKASIHGPKDIPLAQQAVLHLPAGHSFVPQAQATALLRALGNPGEYKKLQGLVVPEADGAGWFALVEYEPSGYVKDGDAKEWNADELLKSYREGTDAQNAEREKMGVPALEIVGWAEKPAYAADSHRLVWAMAVRSKGEAADAKQSVNYNTFALGREGYLSLNLITGMDQLAAHKQDAQLLLAAMEFDAGKRYADFNASTDHVAEYGLAALVVGVGAKKLGLLAVIFAFVAKFAKVILLAVAAFGGAFAKFFKRKPKIEG